MPFKKSTKLNFTGRENLISDQVTVVVEKQSLPSDKRWEKTFDVHVLKI